MDWDGLAKQLGGTAIVVAALAWLAKTLITHWMSKGIEKYKTELGHANDLAIEELRHRFEMETVEHGIRFTKLHERQADILSEVYALLYDFQQRVISYVNPVDWGSEPDKAGKRELIRPVAKSLYEAFYPRRLYFPSDVGDRVDQLFTALSNITLEFQHGYEQEQSGRGESSRDHWSKCIEDIKSKAKPLFAELEREFQQLLGVVAARDKSTP